MAVVSPRSEFHEATLLVEWKPFDIHLAAGLVDGRWIPVDQTRMMDSSFGE